MESKANKAVTELHLSPKIVVKEECLNHAHKHMDTPLINLSKWKKLRGDGYGRLTKEKVIKFEYYYRGAFKSNCMSTDESPQHDQCTEKWSFYLKAFEGDDPISPHSNHIYVLPSAVSIKDLYTSHQSWT